MWTKAFWKGAIERALKTAAQAAIALLAADGVNLLNLDWPAFGAVVLWPQKARTTERPAGPHGLAGRSSASEVRRSGQGQRRPARRPGALAR